MKRALIILPVLLLTLLNACGSVNTLPQFSNDQWTAIAATQQVMQLSPEQKILYWLRLPPANPNSLDALSQALVGQYQVVKVVFSPLSASSNVLQVVVSCQCPPGVQCFSPDQMFMAVMLKMHPYRDQVIAEVPALVTKMWVVRDAEASVPLGMLPEQGKSVDWDDMKSFLHNEMDGSQFSILVTPGAVP